MCVAYIIIIITIILSVLHDTFTHSAVMNPCFIFNMGNPIASGLSSAMAHL